MQLALQRPGFLDLAILVTLVLRNPSLGCPNPQIVTKLRLVDLLHAQLPGQLFGLEGLIWIFREQSVNFL